MSLIGKEIGDFKVNAFHNEVTSLGKSQESTLGKSGPVLLLSS